MKRLLTLTLAGFAFFSSPIARKASADAWDKKTYVTLSEPIEIPGMIVQPGNYVFKLVNNSADRYTVQILNDRENHVYAVKFAVPKLRSNPADKTILTFYETPAGQPPALHTWYYPGESMGREFMYPKDRVDFFAQVAYHNPPVVAEAPPVAAEPSPTVTLSEPTSETSLATTAETTSDVDRAAPATPPPATEPESDGIRTASPSPDTDSAATPEQTPAEQPATPQELPKTASELPLLGLVGLVALAAAGGLKLARSRPR